MSESLTKLAQRIDFSGKEDTATASTNGHGTSSNENGDKVDEDTTDGGTDITFKTAPSWPWESVRNKIRLISFFSFLDWCTMQTFIQFWTLFLAQRSFFKISK